MSRVINPNQPGKVRNQLMKAAAMAKDELKVPGHGNHIQRDLISYLYLTLDAIGKTVEQTAGAWEKRDYWVKADKFRLEWSWVPANLHRIEAFLNNETWNELPAVISELDIKLNKVKYTKKLRSSRPWDGAWDEYRQKADLDPSGQRLEAQNGHP